MICRCLLKLSPQILRWYRQKTKTTQSKQSQHYQSVRVARVTTVYQRALVEEPVTFRVGN